MQASSPDLPMMISGAITWIEKLRQTHRVNGYPIPLGLRPTLARYFPVATLARIRVCRVAEIPNPDFYVDLSAQGTSMPIDFRQMHGLTLIDTVLIADRCAGMQPEEFAALLFHEAVHVVQYECLGLERFADEYISGWARSGFDYYSIPLERQAYALEKRFRSAPASEFSVLEEVRAVSGSSDRSLPTHSSGLTSQKATERP